jgi:hypothetical protein
MGNGVRADFDDAVAFDTAGIAAIRVGSRARASRFLWLVLGNISEAVLER